MQKRVTDALRNLELLEAKALTVLESAMPPNMKRLRMEVINRAITEAQDHLRQRARVAGLEPGLPLPELRRQVPTYRRRAASSDRESFGRRISDYIGRPKAS